MSVDKERVEAFVRAMHDVTNTAIDVTGLPVRRVGFIVELDDGSAATTYASRADDETVADEIAMFAQAFRSHAEELGFDVQVKHARKSTLGKRTINNRPAARRRPRKR